jgi:hypothetical protein
MNAHVSVHFEKPAVVATSGIAHETVNVIEANDDGEARPHVGQSGRLANGVDFDSPVIIESLAVRAHCLRPKAQRLPLGSPEHLTVHPVSLSRPFPLRESR